MTEPQNPELPPLPQRAAHVLNMEARGCGAAVFDETNDRAMSRGCNVFTADQMREYGELCARLAREAEREKLCEELPDLAYDLAIEYANNGTADFNKIASAIRSNT